MKRFTKYVFYLLKTTRWDLMILPFVLWLIFILVVWIKGSNVEQVVGGFLGFGLSLLAGIMASSGFLDIPSLEIIVSFPRTPFTLISERLLMILIVISFTAISFQGVMGTLNINLQFLGTSLNRQMAWFLPTILFLIIGCFSSLLLTKSIGGTVVVSIVWVLQIVAHEVFMNSSIGRRIFIFLSIFQTSHPDLTKNYLSLVLIFLFLLSMTGFLVRKTERYI